MPVLKAKVVESEQTWTSPDGKMTIHKVGLKLDGQDTIFPAKTFSNAIAQVGFEGEIETYEKPNKTGGSDTFVKQPQKEFTPGGFGGGFKGGSRKPEPRDDYTMYLSYVKDIAVALIAADKYSIEQLAQIVEDIGQEGKHLHGLKPMSDEDLKKDSDDLKAELDKTLGEGTKLSEEEDPWKALNL